MRLRSSPALPSARALEMYAGMFFSHHCDTFCPAMKRRQGDGETIRNSEPCRIIHDLGLR